MATRHPRMSFRDRVTTALFDDIYERDLEFDAKIIAEIERLKAIETAAEAYMRVAISPLDDDAAEFTALCELLEPS